MMSSRYDDWHPRRDAEPTYTVTVYLAAPGTPLRDPQNGQMSGTSAAGHMYYSISDGKQIDGYGFSPIAHGEANGPGRVARNEYLMYQDPAYSRTIEITRDQYDRLKEFGEAAVDRRPQGFDLDYNGLSNSCIDFTWAGLNRAGLHRTTPALDEELRRPQRSFEGHVKVLDNIHDVQSIQAPFPDSPHNREVSHPVPERSLMQKLLTEEEGRDGPPSAREAAAAPSPTPFDQQHAIDKLSPQERGTFDRTLQLAQRHGLSVDQSQNAAMLMVAKVGDDPLVQRVDRMSTAGAVVFASFHPHGDREPIFHAYVDLNQAGEMRLEDSAQRISLQQHLSQQQSPPSQDDPTRRGPSI